MFRNQLLCASVVLAAAPAFAFELRTDKSGATVSFERAVQFVADKQLGALLKDKDALEAVAKAIDVLDEATPGLSVTLAEGDAQAMGYDFSANAKNQSIITALESWPYNATALAVTIVSVNTATHRIVDADIAFNAATFGFKVFGAAGEKVKEYDNGPFQDVQNTVTHELGHALGLLHNDADPKLVMYPGAKTGETVKRTLAADDKEGLKTLYGNDVSGAVSKVGEGGETAPLQGCSAAPAPMALSLLGLLASMVRRKKAQLKRAAVVAAVIPSVAFSADKTAPVEEAVPASVVTTQTVAPKAGAQVLFTRVELRLDRCPRFQPDCSRTIELHVPGGKWGEIEQHVVEAPLPVPGQRVLLHTTPSRTRLVNEVSHHHHSSNKGAVR